MAGVRLQKYLADCGVASRRQAEQMIRDGRVSVNGRRVEQLGVKVYPELDRVAVDGIPVTAAQKKVYYMVNKPPGYLSTARDERGRKTVMDLLPAWRKERLYPVGRLDLWSEGLMLLTNDGRLALKLQHPRYGVEKTYLVTVAGEPSPALLAQMEKGMILEDGPTLPARITVIHRGEETAELEFVLKEGRKRQIRRMCAAAGYPVRRLRRIAIGPLKLGELQPGGVRRLRPNEVAALYAAAGEEPDVTN
ncbi:MAG TPA: rRNA pseudouridine synthase [Firmicutes bacterium]|nr:rRNA pseudouridine synthase [Bacillota bacterium]